jgi:cyanophycinase-like exopeptidase
MARGERAAHDVRNQHVVGMNIDEETVTLDRTSGARVLGRRGPETGICRRDL